MNTALVYTTDDLLKKELAAALPKDFTLQSNVKKAVDAVVFVDLDTMKTGLISELSEKGVVVAVTRLKNTELAMKAVTAGAYETMQRPLQRAELLLFFDEVHMLRNELKQVIEIRNMTPVPTCAIVGHSPSIMNTCKKLARLAQVEAPVLITGETGTGKELIAESIAQLSSRFGKPFVVVNCAAVPDNLLESELFGFEKGSFTGASAAKEGMLKIADEGSVFFDEIGEMPLALQGKLLRFLQTQTFYPLGSIREVQVNVRVISATNRDLASMVTPKGPLLEISDEQWHAGLDLAVLNVVRMARLVTPIMQAAGGGAIVNISTFAAYEPDPGFPVSASLRAALGSFAKLYADTYAADGIRMNNVLPGFIESYPVEENTVARIPMGRAGTVEEIAKTVAFLLSDGAGYITGQNIKVDGGITRSV